MTRRVRDTALWMDIAQGPEPDDLDSPSPPAGTYLKAAARDPGELRVCWSLSTPRAVMPPLYDPAIEAAVERIARKLGQPAASIPAGSTPEGLPLAVQLVVPANRKDLLLSLAAQLEDELGWSKRRRWRSEHTGVST